MVTIYQSDHIAEKYVKLLKMPLISVVFYCVVYFQSNYGEMMNRYKQLLLYIKSAVTRNYSEKSINSILDYISTSKQMDLLQVSS